MSASHIFNIATDYLGEPKSQNCFHPEFLENEPGYAVYNRK
jgi:hypothetical protein